MGLANPIICFGRGARTFIAAALGLTMVILATPLLSPAHAATLPTDKLRRSGQVASPSVVLIRFNAEAYLNDNRDGSTNGPYKIGWWGTGFFVSSDGNIATAAHVAAPTSDELKRQMAAMYVRKDAIDIGCEAQGNCDALVAKYQARYEVATSLSNLQTHLYVYTQDMTIDSQGLTAQVKTSSPSNQSDVAVIKANQDNAPVAPLVNPDKVQTQDPVSVIGYPGVADTSAKTLLVPTVTTGTITAKKQGSEDLGIAPGVSIFQTDASVERGNSGSPAVNENGEVVGLVSFGTGERGSTNFLISVNEIKDQVKQAGVSTTVGQIDRVWRQGLGYFDQHRYVKAKAAFDQCVALNKIQVGCAEWSQKASGLLGQDEERKYAKTGFQLPAGVVAGAGVWLLVLVAAAATGLVLVLRRRSAASRRQASDAAAQPVQQLAPTSEWQATPSQAPPTEPHKPGTVGFQPPQAVGAPTVHPASRATQNFCSNCGSPLTAGQTTCVPCGHTAR